MDMKERDLSGEMAADRVLIEYLRDEDIAKEFYAALCNMEWRPIKPILPDDEEIMKRLKGEEESTWSCSWRSAGGIIANIRHDNYNTNENYMNFYCSGSEGYVSPLVEECLKRMGWEPVR